MKRRRRRHFFPSNGRERRRAADAVRRLTRPTLEEILEAVVRSFEKGLRPFVASVEGMTKSFARMAEAIGKIPIKPAEFVQIDLTQIKEPTP